MLGLEESVVILAQVELKDCKGDRGQSAGRSVRRVKLLGLQEGGEGFHEEGTIESSTKTSSSIHWTRGSRRERADE